MPEPETYSHIGQVIRAEREQRGWRQSDLAERVGVSPEYISMVETGRPRYTNMRLDNVGRFAKAFDLHALDLISMLSSMKAPA